MLYHKGADSQLFRVARGYLELLRAPRCPLQELQTYSSLCGVTRNCSELRVASLQGPTHICSKLLGVARSPALHPNRGLLIFTRIHLELLGAARCTPTGAYSYLLKIPRSFSEQLYRCQLSPLQHTGACSDFLGEKVPNQSHSMY